MRLQCEQKKKASLTEGGVCRRQTEGFFLASLSEGGVCRRQTEGVVSLPLWREVPNGCEAEGEKFPLC